MKIPFVDLHAQYLTIKHEIDRAIAEVIARSAFIRGPHVDAFEEAWARTLGVKRCGSCANGTDAIYIALRGLGLKRGDEVITSAHSWISTSQTITHAGGRVVFCDTDEETFTIDPIEIERKITPATVGIVPVHLYGQAADMSAIMAIAKKHNLWVLEDCAQAHLAKYSSRYVGTFGNAGTFSFYPGKNRGVLRKHLSKGGISTVLNYPKALPFFPAYAHLSHVPKDFPVAYFNQSRILSLPIFPEMTKEMIDYVVSQIRNFFNGNTVAFW